jgi:hypothetical protein
MIVGPGRPALVTGTLALSIAGLLASALGMGDEGGGGTCPHPIDRFSFQITGDGFGGLGCGAAAGTLSVTATVTAVDPDLAYMELSTVATNCSGSVLLSCPGAVRLYIGSLDFTLPIIQGANVTLTAAVTETPYGCAQALAVVNLPNEHYPQATVWFAGADGSLSTPLGGQIQAQEARGCGAASRPGFLDEAITISIPSASPDTVTLAGGDLRVIPGTTWAVKNLRSFRAEGAPADDMHDFAFWAAYEAPPNQ